MSATQPTDERFQYSEMNEAEAYNYLALDFGLKEIGTWADRNHIKNSVDVLYYADAFGDLEHAILLQAFDKSLPTQVYESLLETGWDLFEAVNCADLETFRCPGCDTEMWEIEIDEGHSYTSREWIDEYGNTSEFVEFVDDPAGRIWNADREADHSPALCWCCSNDVHYDFPRRISDSGSVVVHYGETDEVSAFAVWNGLVRWEEDRFDSWNAGNWADLLNVPGDTEDMAHAFATSSPAEFMQSVGYVKLHESDVLDALPIRRRTHRYRSEYRAIVAGWAEGQETNPALGFTYIIDYTGYRSPSFWVAEDNYDELLGELVDQYMQEYSR